MRNIFLIIFIGIILSSGSFVFAGTIHFAGVEWHVKDGGPWGPGPNFWSGSEQSVWVDAQGRLHLKIRKEGNVWYCAEVNTLEYTTYGEHRFLVEGQIDQMDRNIVLGLFIYADDTHEIDVEYAKWGDANKEDVGSFTVQPYTTTGNQHSFVSPLDSAKSTHYFNWQPDIVSFASMQGLTCTDPLSGDDYIEEWTYSGSDIPLDSDSLHTHINLWLMNGYPPMDLTVLEVIISDVVQPLTTSALKDAISKNPLSGITLSPNYPNPFNPKTVISYKLSAISKVQLTVFNILGQKVRTLVKEKQAAGQYSVTFDAGNLASGIYVYRLSTDNGFVQTKKMILIR